jgi:O-antigen/teichoic acid export membrane protein
MAAVLTSRLSEARRRLVFNISSNILAIIISSAVAILLTPYLIKHLGLAAYGVVPLILSIAPYFDLITFSITSTVGRFVALHYNTGDFEKANNYFSSAVLSLAGLCGVLLAAGMIVAAMLPRIFNIPRGLESDARWMFVFMIFSSIATAVAGPFQAGTFLTHRFDLDNIRKVISKLLQVAVLIGCFSYVSISIRYVGLSYLAMSAFMLTAAFFLRRKLTPELKVNPRHYSMPAVHDMGQMGFWMLVDQIGSALCIGANLLVINIVLGSEQSGRYGAIVQLGTFIYTLGAAICTVFAPVTFEYIARGEIKELARQLRRVVKYMGLIMALPVGLICGFARPLLKIWLGEQFANLAPLMWILIVPMGIGIVINQLLLVGRGLNKIKLPATATVLGGILNLGLSVVLAKFTGLGIFGVGLSFATTMMLINVFVIPCYSAHLLHQRKFYFILSFIPGAVIFAFISIIALIGTEIFPKMNLFFLAGASLIITCFYGFAVYGFAFGHEDRIFIKSILNLKNKSIAVSRAEPGDFND